MDSPIIANLFNHLIQSASIYFLYRAFAICFCLLSPLRSTPFTRLFSFSCSHSQAQAHTFTLIHACTRTCPHMHTHAHTRTRTHIYAQSHPHTHRKTHILASSFPFKLTLSNLSNDSHIQRHARTHEQPLKLITKLLHYFMQEHMHIAVSKVSCYPNSHKLKDYLWLANRFMP